MAEKNNEERQNYLEAEYLRMVKINTYRDIINNYRKEKEELERR